MSKLTILFEYSIKNGELLKDVGTIPINEEEVQIIGIETQKLFYNDPVRFLRIRTALFINFRGNQYGNQYLTVDQLVSQLKTCCIVPIDPLKNRIHSIEHAIEFN